MADNLNGTDLAALHQAIVDVSAAAFPGVWFGFYREDREQLLFGDGIGANPPRAYVLMELAELDASDFDPGTEQQQLTARFEANVVVKSLQPNAKVLVRALAASFAAFIRKQSRFNPAAVFQGAARVIGVYKDDFAPELDQYEVWRVEWAQEVAMGDGEIWKPDPNINPAELQVLYSYEPIIGTAYEPDYQDISGLPRA
jgi:hypothetical protein